MKQLKAGFCVLLGLGLLSHIAEGGALAKRPRRPVAAKIVLNQSDVKLRANQTTEIKATVLDPSGKEISDARLTWQVLGETDNAITIRPLNKAQTDILITARDIVS